MASLFYSVSLVAGIAGWAMLAAVWFRRGWARTHLVGRWVKYVGKVVQLVATVVGTLRSVAADGDQEQWWHPALASAFAVAGWALLELAVDDVLKEVDKADKKELAAAKDEAASLMKLLSNFRDLADGKARRLAQSLAAGDQRRSITTVRQALVPAEHVTDVMQAMLVYFRSQLPATGGAVRNFRAVLYSEQAGVMVPTHCLDLKQPGVGVASLRSSRQDAAEAFRLDCRDEPSHTVLCVRRRETVIVEDCVSASERGEFRFFHDGQRGYLKSMLAIYLGQVCGPGGAMAEAALVIDTDQPDFFRRSDIAALELAVLEFATRVKLELLLDAATRQPSS